MTKLDLSSPPAPYDDSHSCHYHGVTHKIAGRYWNAATFRGHRS
jgi:hypothetical protein